MMRPDHIRSVQATWLRVLPVKDATARLFYERLFEMDPSLKRMFRSDMDQQGEKLMQVIDAAINGLALFEQIRSSIQELGRRHANYGVKDHHYGTVGAALLWALGKSLGPEFTPQVRHAWITVYGALAATMREAASGAAHDAHRPARLVEVAAAASGPNPRDAA